MTDNKNIRLPTKMVVAVASTNIDEETERDILDEILNNAKPHKQIGFQYRFIAEIEHDDEYYEIAECDHKVYRSIENGLNNLPKSVFRA